MVVKLWLNAAYAGILTVADCRRYTFGEAHEMTPSQLEKRLAVLEAELAKLKSKVEGSDAAKPWWEEIAGTFQDDPIYVEAMKLGRQYRQSQQPRAASRKKD